jgi:hypothetical protein
VAPCICCLSSAVCAVLCAEGCEVCAPPHLSRVSFSTNINKLAAEAEAAKKAAETRELMENAKKNKKKKNELDVENPGDEVMRFMLPCLSVSLSISR